MSFSFFIINILVQMWQQSIDSEIIKVVIFWVAFIILFFLIGAYVQKKRFRHGLLVAIIVSLFSIHSIIRSDTDGLARIFFIIGVHFFMLIGIGLSKLVIKSDQHSQKAGRIAKIGFAALILVLFIGAYVTPILPAYICRINQAEGPNQANKALVDAVESNNKHFSKYGRYAYDMRELNEFGYSQSQYPEMEIKIITVMDDWYLLSVHSKISDGQTEKYFFSNDENRLIPIDKKDIIFTPEDRHNSDVQKYTDFSLEILNGIGYGADEMLALGLVAITDKEAVLYFQYRELKKEWRGFFLNSHATHYVVYDLKNDMPRFRSFLVMDVKGKREQIISDFRKLAKYDLGAE